jgi:hypothetical protein
VIADELDRLASQGGLAQVEEAEGLGHRALRIEAVGRLEVGVGMLLLLLLGRDQQQRQEVGLGADAAQHVGRPRLEALAARVLAHEDVEDEL